MRSLSQYCDLTTVSTCTTVYECTMSVLLYATSDVITQCMERGGRRAAVVDEVGADAPKQPSEPTPDTAPDQQQPEPASSEPSAVPGPSAGLEPASDPAPRDGLDCDRTVRGAVCNLVTGGGAINWYWWLLLDRLIPGATLRPLFAKAMIDCLLWMPVCNVAFIWLFNYTRSGAEFALLKVKQDVCPYSVVEFPLVLVQDMATFFFTGWGREIFSDVLTVAGNIVSSYFANRPLHDTKRVAAADEDEEDVEEEGEQRGKSASWCCW
eukprot:TRINITY_DN2938_c0_g3_i1.p1 TRINITY_DN2938_c0_g3~~TRINITY_DN2938_c0_g3_i1.p1  ORF type:complete len:266 (+),score=64.17 TRINITY_DN2938_c0_g3_i1:66-863(+)